MAVHAKRAEDSTLIQKTKVILDQSSTPLGETAARTAFDIASRTPYESTSSVLSILAAATRPAR